MLRADAAGRQTIQCEYAVDMWSVGVIMFELYTGQRFLDPNDFSQHEAFSQVGVPGSRGAAPYAQFPTRCPPPMDDQ